MKEAGKQNNLPLKTEVVNSLSASLKNSCCSSQVLKERRSQQAAKATKMSALGQGCVSDDEPNRITKGVVRILAPKGAPHRHQWLRQPRHAVDVPNRRSIGPQRKDRGETPRERRWRSDAAMADGAELMEDSAAAERQGRDAEGAAAERRGDGGRKIGDGDWDGIGNDG
ncbi:hypothetical protein PR202_gb03393 [Eleusine coracana subsp. coracana]|uniref:Uncharacterized protein n=1 Tax=Eleusine coracana subsp. coracana TaxID=191504 RepID=A0AAV5DZC5_ELECO|nr:hypothetical protein PR202_gb03393 [Eleusine coracana subsp. coracana]